MAQFTKKEILDNISNDNEREKGVHYILKKLNVAVNEVKPEDFNRLRNAVSTLTTKRKIKLEKASRKRARFEKDNAEWLSSSFQVPEFVLENHASSSSSGPGRPSLSFSRMSDRSKRRVILQVSEQCKHDPLRILMAAQCATNHSKMTDLGKIIKKVLSSHADNTEVNQLLYPPRPVVPKTTEEALAFILDNDLSKNVYSNIRLASKSSEADIWPAYNHVRDVKAQCRPPKEDIKINEEEAVVNLQSLLFHTAQKVVQLQREVFLQIIQTSNPTVIEAVFIFSWGFDGSTGQSSYKQQYEPQNNSSKLDDSSLFVTTCNPLRLTTSTGDVIWNNLASQSERMCRPILIKYAKETSALTLKQKQSIEEQINELECLEIMLGDCRIRIHFSLHLTLIDGKVLSTITNTKSMQSCPICHAKPKQFNDLSNRDKGTFIPNPNSLQFGISPLHAWIRLLELVLNIAYRLYVKKWQMRSVKDKAEFARRKKEVQEILWQKLGIKVGIPISGGAGTSNDGNTARRAFKNPAVLAKCLGLDEQLLRNFRTILIALSCHLPIDPVLFGDLCNATAEIYVKSYNWYNMSSTLHKILIHGSAIISTSVLPVGMLAEEASEARNKSYKNFRKNHSRKSSREATLTDLFYRSMDSTDPKISTVSLMTRLNKNKKLPLPHEVIQLLAVPEIETYSSIIDDKETDDEDDGNNDGDDDCTGLQRTFAILDHLELESEEIEETEETEEIENIEEIE